MLMIYDIFLYVLKKKKRIRLIKGFFLVILIMNNKKITELIIRYEGLKNV